MDNRRLFLAALLSLAVLLIWQWLFPPEPQRTTAPATEVVDELSAAGGDGRPSGTGRSSSATGGQAESVSETEQLEREELEREEPPVSRAVIESSREETVVFENDEARIEFSNRGAELVSFVLKNHPDSEGGQVDLVRRRAEGPYPFGFVARNGEPHALSRELFAVERTTTNEVAFEYSGTSGRARKEFRLTADGMLDIEIEAEGEDWSVLLGPGIRNPSEREQRDRFARKSVVYFEGGKTESLQASGTDERTIIAARSLRWVGVQDTYFLAGFIPELPLDTVVVDPVIEVPSATGNRFRRLLPGEELSGDEEDLPRELICALRGEDGSVRGRAYLGAKQYDRLKALADPETGLAYGLEQAVELGFFGFFSKWLLVGLRWIHDHMVGNYGWAIILMTVVIRMLLFPLTHKSFVSMQKMQELNPKIQAIRQKYRSRLKDKQGRPNAEAQRKMNEEVMGLYKKEGVNPAGGCLPMLLQLPVLFAFYRLLSAAVEIRHAPWIGWIRDLSAPDPFYVLPLVMGASQFIQQKMTPTTADPMQRRIFMLMPVFFTVLFLGFPSGLVLYWLTNNVLGIVQQGVYRRLRHPAGGKT